MSFLLYLYLLELSVTQNGGGDRPRKVQFSAIVGTSEARNLDLDLDLGSGQCYISIHNARPRDCSLKQYGYMALWSSCNIGIPQSLKSHDSFLRRKFKHSPGRGLTVIATSVHGLLHPTCNHNHKLLASGSAEMKPRDINISQTLMSCDHQLGEKFRNVAPKSCRLGAILL